MQQFIVKRGEDNQKLLNFVRKSLNNVSLSLIHMAFRKKDIKVNGIRKDKDYLIQQDDVIQVYLPDHLIQTEENTFQKTPITFEVVFEDDNILIVNKPAGLLVVEDSDEKVRTLANQVVNYYIEKGFYSPEQKGFIPAPVHRLDRNTSGLVIIAKNILTSQCLTTMFKNRQGLEKSYQALVKGIIDEPGEINLPLLKDAKKNTVKVVIGKGLTAQTLYSPVASYQDCTLLNIIILTGRTHQIRVHMQAIGHPVVGDAKYGDFTFNHSIKEKYHFENQFLHAQKLRFGKLNAPLEYLSFKEFEAPLTKTQKELLKNLSPN